LFTDRTQAVAMANANARALRRDMMEVERRLRFLLRGRRLGGNKFLRQHPIGSFIADFVCLRHRLVVEPDGGQHGEVRAAYDVQRTAWLEAQGRRVMRL
jgi:very-short-patch-repair endonuclease